VLRISDGLFPNAREASRLPAVAYEERIIDAMAALLVRDASAFSTWRHTNMFDIYPISRARFPQPGACAPLNAGTDHAVAQAQHGSAPDIAGKDRANPASLIGSVAMLLAWLGERRGDERLTKAASAIDDALESVIADPQSRIADLGGPLGTRAFGERVAGRLSAGSRDDPS
jgi:3-isopropylmalate dehydrogenase